VVTLFKTIWDRHVVPDFNGNCFAALAARGLRVAHPELTFATAYEARVKRQRP
jgi:hypothetical protein